MLTLGPKYCGKLQIQTDGIESILVFTTPYSLLRRAAITPFGSKLFLIKLMLP